jgi:prepilin peptidase CpaA
MELFSVTNWPLWVVCTAMVASAVIDWWKFKVPNWLTFPLILSGWFLGLVHTLDWFPGTGAGGIGAALAGTFFACALLLPVYAIGGMGAGDVKMTMGFGSWTGAFFGFEHDALWIIFYAFCVGVIAGGFIAAGMMVVRGQYSRNLAHTREIIGDLFSSSSVTEVAEKAQRRRSRWHRLPYGIPLCIGFVGYLVYLHGL